MLAALFEFAIGFLIGGASAIGICIAIFAVIILDWMARGSH